MNKILLLTLSFLLFSCQSDDERIPEFALESPDEFSQDVYEVYGVILENYSQAQVVIRQQTSAQTPTESAFDTFFSLEKMAQMEATLFSNYVTENSAIGLLDDRISVDGKEIHLISNEEYSFFFERQNLNKAWSLFQTKYQGSGAWFIIVNKVGFNETQTQAIVGIESYWYMDAPDGPTLSAGRLHYLEKNNDVWEEIGSAGYSLN